MQTEEERWGNVLQGARMRKYNWAVPIRYPASSPPVCQSSGKFFCFSVLASPFIPWVLQKAQKNYYHYSVFPSDTKTCNLVTAEPMRSRPKLEKVD
jgi:hypothetical protein